MAYLLVLLAVAAVLGPLMAVLPSRRQRTLAALRDRARELGLNVAIRGPDNVPPRLQRATDVPLVTYSLRWPPRTASTVRRDMYVRTRDGWQSRSSEPVPAELESLPESLEVVLVGWDDIRLFWDERGEADAVETLAQVAYKLAGMTPPSQPSASRVP